MNQRVNATTTGLSGAQMTKPLTASPKLLVKMSKVEVELYIKEGRPTGLLLRSVALLTGMTAESIAKSCGIAEALVRSMFEDHGMSSIKSGAIRRVADVLGIDSAQMRFASGRVHSIELSRIPMFTSAAEKRKISRAVGLLARGAQVVEMKSPASLQQLLSGRKMFAMQTSNFRVICVAGIGSGFDIDTVPSAVWGGGEHSKSIIPVLDAEMAENLKALDLTESEFDELFEGLNAATWADIKVASRFNGVSKKELMAFIKSRAVEFDEDDDAAPAAAETRAPLRLVEVEQKVANG